MSGYQIGETVVVEGRASPTAAGASVTTDDRETFYVGGLDAWDPELELKRVRVTGVLRLRPAMVAERPPEEDQEHGLTDDTFVIDNASWSLVEDA
jgi:hypothetical protein